MSAAGARRAGWGAAVAWALAVGVLSACAPAGDDGGDGGGDGAGDGPTTDPAAIATEVRAALAVELSDDELRRTLQHSPLPPAPRDPTNRYSGHDGAAALGRALFYDTRFSADGTVGCVSCHLPDRALADGRSLALGLETVSRNAPALWNMGHNRWFFWDGRADSLWAQALAPFEDPKEHGFSRVGVVRAVGADPELRAAYEEVFGAWPALPDEPPHGGPFDEDVRHPHRKPWLALGEEQRAAFDGVYANLGKAIAAFVERFVSDAAPFDAFVEGLRRGDRERLAALDAAAQRGLQLFMGRGNCWVCHTGPNFTDREFHDIRVPALEGLPADVGRLKGMDRLFASAFRSDGVHSDDPDHGDVKIGYLNRDGHFGWRQFKTPSLRNVAVTAPYMHQGQMATLADVVRYYSTLEGAVESVHPEKILQPLELTPSEQADLVAFLRSLTDADVPAELRAPSGS